MIENTSTDVSENKHLTYASLILVIGASFSLFIPPLSLILGVLGFILSWKARQLSISGSATRNIANISLVIAAIVILISAVITLLSFPSSITGRVVK